MASFKKDNKTVEGSRGVKCGIIKDFKSKGLKVTEKGNVFENGYLFMDVYCKMFSFCNNFLKVCDCLHFREFDGL